MSEGALFYLGTFVGGTIGFIFGRRGVTEKLNDRQDTFSDRLDTFDTKMNNLEKTMKLIEKTTSWQIESMDLRVSDLEKLKDEFTLAIEELRGRCNPVENSSL